MNLWNETKSILDLYNKSRMMGDYHVRFCERLGVKAISSQFEKKFEFIPVFGIFELK